MLRSLSDRPCDRAGQARGGVQYGLHPGLNPNWASPQSYNTRTAPTTRTNTTVQTWRPGDVDSTQYSVSLLAHSYGLLSRSRYCRCTACRVPHRKEQTKRRHASATQRPFVPSFRLVPSLTLWVVQRPLQSGCKCAAREATWSRSGLNASVAAAPHPSTARARSRNASGAADLARTTRARAAPTSTRLSRRRRANARMTRRISSRKTCRR